MIGDLLAGLNEDEIRLLGDGSKGIELSAGQVLFRPGDPASSLYIVYGGEILITSGKDTNAEFGFTLGAGDFFGEIAAIEGKAHTATASAVTEASLVEIDWRLLEDLMARQPKLSRNMTQSLTERMRETDRRLITKLQSRADEYQRLLERSSIVLGMARQVNDILNWDELWQKLLDAAIANVKAERGTLYVLDPAGKKLTGHIIRGDDLQELSLPLGHGIAGNCALTGEAELIYDAQLDPRFAPEIDLQTGFSSRGMICVPFKDVNGVVKGIVQLINSTVGSFNTDDLDFLKLMADQFAMGREKAAAVTTVIEQEVSDAISPTLTRLESLLTDDLKDQKSPIFIELKRLIQAFDSNLEAKTKPFRFQNFVNELITEFAALPADLVQIHGKLYDGFLNADGDLLKATIAMIVHDSAMAGATMVSISSRDDEDELELDLAILPAGVTPSSSSPGMQLARKVAKLHRGTMRLSNTQGGGTLISLTIALHK